MNRRRLMFMGAVSLAIGGLLSSVVYRQLQKNPVSERTRRVDAVVAANNIPIGKKIEDRDLQVVSSSRRFLASRCPAHEKEHGRPATALPVEKGDFVTPFKLRTRLVCLDHSARPAGRARARE